MIDSVHKIEEGNLRTKFGRTWYRIVNNQKRTKLTPLICLHGGPGYPHDSIATLAALADERPVIFYDQIGCGRSDKLALKHWRIETFITELEQLRSDLGISTFHLFGHS